MTRRRNLRSLMPLLRLADTARRPVSASACRFYREVRSDYVFPTCGRVLHGIRCRMSSYRSAILVSDGLPIDKIIVREQR